MRYRELILESKKPSWLGLDNPGGEWLERAKEKCESSPIGIRGNPTGYTKKAILIQTNDLMMVKGRNGEHQFRTTSSKFDALQTKVDAEGFNNKEFPILVEINYQGVPYISEGNHRTAVAYMDGIPAIWAMVQWYGGSESLDGEWSPESLHKKWAAISSKPIDEAFDAREVEWIDDETFTFAVNDVSYTAKFVPNSQMPGHYIFIFAAKYRDEEGKMVGSIGNTGLMGHSAIHVLSHIVTGLETFLTKNKPNSVEFTADKTDNKHSLYLAMAKRLKKRVTKLGYRVWAEEDNTVGSFGIEPIPEE